MLQFILLWMHVCSCCVCDISFSIISQEVGNGWEEDFWNDLFCIGCDIKR